MRYYDKEQRRDMYRAMLPMLVRIARNHGYCLAVHGSETRDLDLVAVPWVECPSEPELLAEAIRLSTNAYNHADYPNPEMKPHGRFSYSFYMQNSGYIDLSIMPPVKKAV
ncbi:MAG: hypothetical protein EKK48_12330 [Candidatus Melainabacteria bacterium]|nr:MAG: hypothetical protein EKK48_12330 [Candidatus Melainabacteria bacterium]